MSLTEAEQTVGAALSPANRFGSDTKATGRTTDVLLRDDHLAAYPVLPDAVPVLMGPEMLVPKTSEVTFDLTLPQYAEAYAEMGHYNSTDWRAVAMNAAFASGSPLGRLLSEDELTRQESYPANGRHWLDATHLWLDAKYDCLAQRDCYIHMGEVRDKCFMQLGGSGLHAIKFLLAGADTAILVTPMIGELRYAQALAIRANVSNRFDAVLGIGEEMPLADSSVDAIYSGGCLHHMDTQTAAREIDRVLVPGGSFAAAEPWRSPLYALGTKVFGKRETNVYCRPLDNGRIQPISEQFRESRVVHHGALSRYLLLALAKLGISPPLARLFQIFRVDDALSDKLPGVRNRGSSVAVLARRTS